MGRTRCWPRRSSRSGRPRISTSRCSSISRTTPWRLRSRWLERSAWNELGDFEPAGVNERLVRKVRDALDADGFEHVKIVVSGGFTVEKIEAFEHRGVPVDAYGVGSSLIRGENDFTADVVMTDGRASSKVGRRFRENPRLARVE